MVTHQIHRSSVTHSTLTQTCFETKGKLEDVPYTLGGEANRCRKNDGANAERGPQTRSASALASSGTSLCKSGSTC